MHEVLVNRLGGLSLPRKSVVRLTDRPDMTLDVYRGRKTTIQPANGLYVSQLVRYARASCKYQDFVDRGKLLTSKLLAHVYRSAKIVSTIKISYQSVPQDQKSVTFSHSVISLYQLLQNSKNTAYIFLTFRNHVKIFLSQNILQNISNVVYRTTLSIRTERTDKQ